MFLVSNKIRNFIPKIITMMA